MFTRVICSRKKKTIIYSLFGFGSLYFLLQVIYLNSQFMPLMTLADAESEAQRLLRFIGQNHYSCNVTANSTRWPVCSTHTEFSGVSYSIGPSEADISLERYITQNTSSKLFVFLHDAVFKGIQRLNKTVVYRTTIVANDPSDFGRNSYQSKTLNSIVEALHHKNIDFLKIDRFADSSIASDVLWYMTKDRLLDGAGSIHIAMHIDKIDDDYLYGWYRALYNLFSTQGFRLYHMTASDPACLQVSMLASCVYYMSWLRNPGPYEFILYPPAIDGSQAYEEQRIVDYMAAPQTTCSKTTHAEFRGAKDGADDSDPVAVCDPERMSGACHIVVIVETNRLAHPQNQKLRSCSILIVRLQDATSPHPSFNVLYQKLADSRLRVNKHTMTISELLDHMQLLVTVDFLFLDIPRTIWTVLSPLLNSPVLQSVDQLVIDVMLWTDVHDKHALKLRRRYSQLKRLESHGFRIFYTTPFHSFRLKFLRASQVMENCCFQVSYLNNRNLLRYS